WAATAPTRSLGPSDLVLLDGFAARCGQVLAERSPVPSRDASIARTLALFGARQDAEATEAFTGLVLRVGARLGLDTVALAELEVAARLLHAARGSASIVGELPGFQGAAVLLRFASERWDGRGADGLRGERIPLGSRVLAACAAFANRPEGYRSARGGDTVLRRAQAGSGRTLDPAVVMALSVELLGPVPSIGDPGEPPDPAEWASGDRLFEGAFGQT
ncbi:MAG: hypothetical protein QOJ07_2972, partial [Thermoleophilaceae bacterium]|nr:hypothetical protein [Thermoleophilaceae bacterium]